VSKAVKAATATAKKTTSKTEAPRLAKRWRRATFGSDHTKYGDGAFAQSATWVNEQLEAGRTVEQIARQIDAIRQDRQARQATKPSGTAEVKPETTKSSKPSKAIVNKLKAAK
jgi:hypothetical protein